MHSRKSLLFTEEGPWIKKDGDTFGVTMGSHDGAEVCELVGLFLLNEAKKTFPQVDLGLYRDDGLGAYEKIPGPQAERIKKGITKLFKELGLSITINMNQINADFLDVIMDLPTGKHRPYRKPNNTPLYINAKSNHPPTILKQLPSMIERRISDLSTNETEFNACKDEYNDALMKSGYKESLTFKKSQEPKRRRAQNVIWFKPLTMKQWKQISVRNS